MREILFKAKRKDSSEWVEGSLIITEGSVAYIIRSKSKAFIPKGENIICSTECYEINIETICQYTGLTDKNGQKIWENDILIGHGNDRDLSKVSFGKFYVIDVGTLNRVDEVIGWHTEVIETDALSKCEPFCLPMPLTDSYIEISEFEVFGNIFDNADLLEVE